MFEWIKNIFSNQAKRIDPSKYCVKVTEIGLKLFVEDQLHAILNWSDIQRITTYKYDLFAVDEICIRFEASQPDGLSIEISEEWQGFLETKQMMEKIFPNINEEWYFKVMFPAFKRNETIIYEAGKI